MNELRINHLRASVAELEILLATTDQPNMAAIERLVENSKIRIERLVRGYPEGRMIWTGERWEYEYGAALCACGANHKKHVTECLVLKIDSDEIETTDEYWDCECEFFFIHPKSEACCEVCGAVPEESADSRVDEVFAAGYTLTK